MPRKHRMPRTPKQFLALSFFACCLIALMCLWNSVRYDMPVFDTIRLEPIPDMNLVSKSNRHIIIVPFALFVAAGGIFGAGVSSYRRRKARRDT